MLFFKKMRMTSHIRWIRRIDETFDPTLLHPLLRRHNPFSLTTLAKQGLYTTSKLPHSSPLEITGKPRMCTGWS